MERTGTHDIRNTPFRVNGWRITGLTALAIAVYCGSWIMLYGFEEESIRSLIRATARSSFCLFMLAFSASSLQDLFRAKWSAWLLRNRRYIGVSFAVSHFYHLAFIISLVVLYPYPFLDQLNWIIQIVNVIAYLYIIAMTVTSFDSTRRKLGPRRWRILHTSGSYLVFLIFVASYIPRAMTQDFYIPFVVVLVIVAGLRLARRYKAWSYVRQT